jgi:hypothetical protein
MILANENILQSFGLTSKPSKGINGHYYATVEVFHQLIASILPENSSGGTVMGISTRSKTLRKWCGSMLVSPVILG